VLAIAGGKGGTGKTTMALALARALSRNAAGDVLVVDADVDMPDLHAMAGVDRTPTVLDDRRGVAVGDGAGVRVAPAAPPDATRALRDALAALAERSTVPGSGPGGTRRPVVVDAPCGAGPDAARPLAAADATVLVTRPTPAAVRDTAKTAAMARELDARVASVAVVGERPERSLADAFGVDRTVRVPRVDGDPLESRAVAAAAAELAGALRELHTSF